jgi:FAD dependent oxidoreductase TIGR03364
MEKIIVVGGGVLGTMHAWMFASRGMRVVQLEHDLEARGATVRNFGLVWVSGRAPGEELDTALRARELWEDIAAAVPGVGFRPDGSVTVAANPPELAVLAEAAGRDDAAPRGLELLDAAGVRRANPALRGTFAGGLLCRNDAVVESRRALVCLREALVDRDHRWLPGRTAVQVAPGVVTDSAGEEHRGDLIVACPGANPSGAFAGLVPRAGLRRVRLQMMQTAPLGERLATAVADGGSLRYYPVFDGPARASLPPQEPLAERLRIQLLMAQRAGGELTIGDTHEYDEPFDFALDPEPYALLARRAETLLGRQLPPVRRTWAGVYVEAREPVTCVREEVLPGVVVVTAAGGRGMTLAPAIAERTVAEVLGVRA